MFHPPAEVLAAIDTLGGQVDTAPLARALEGLCAPWRVAVIGRTGVGKSTLVNLLLGRREQPTGLGGITTATAEFALPDSTLLVDTPGIDEAARALSTLAPLLEGVDAVVFVIDGLQPLTATERTVLDAALPPGTPLHLVVSKLDLTDEHEVPRVLQRVTALTRGYAPSSIRRLDLRTATEIPRDLVVPPPSPPARRIEPVRLAIVAVEEALAALPPSPSRAELLQELRARWTDCVRRTERAVDAELGAQADSRLTALHRLLQRAGEAVEALRQEFLQDPRLPSVPELPLPEAPEPDPMKQVLATMAGLETARRSLRAAAARWLLEGEVALVEWAEGLDALDRNHFERKQALEALAAAREAVASGASVAGPLLAE